MSLLLAKKKKKIFLGAEGGGQPFPQYGLQFYAPLYEPNQRGFLLSYDGNDLLSYTVANWRSGDSAGSWEIWFRSSSTTNNQTLIGSSDTGSDTSLIRAYVGATSGKIVVEQQDAGGTINRITGATNVCDGEWHLIVISSSGTAWSIILDGVAESLTLSSGANNGNWFADTTLRDNLTIGAMTYQSGSIGYTIGEIGFVRIYSREMAAAEALANYQLGRKAVASDTTGLVFSLPTTEGTGNPVDTVGSVTMPRTGATWVEGLRDRSPNALALTNFGAVWGIQGRTGDGNDRILAYDGRISNATAGTIIVWVKINTQVVAASLVSYGGGDVAVPGLFDFRIRQDVANYNPAVVQRSDGVTPASIVRGGTTLATATWYQLALVSDGSAWSIYVNAVVETLTVVSGSNSGNWFGDTTVAETDETNLMALLYDGTLANYGNVTQGEVLIYSRALSAGEIQQIYLATKRKYN